MEKYKLFDAEYKFVSIVWENEPVNSTELVNLCHEKLGWKKSTTYTVLRKLCSRGVLQNQNATVSSLIRREETQKYESESLIKKTFDDSLPEFLTAFLDKKKITKKKQKNLNILLRRRQNDKVIYSSFEHEHNSKLYIYRCYYNKNIF